MEAIALVGLVTAAGYFLQDQTVRVQENIRNLNEKDPEITKMSELEKPNSLNIYSSDKVSSANNEVLERSLQNYKDAEDPSITGILPPIFNSYSVIGNDSILNLNLQDKSSVDRARADDINRRTNMFKVQSREINERPMFTTVGVSALDESDNQVYSNFGMDKSSAQNINLLTGKPIEREHANMVPFFGSNVKQNIETFTNVSTLDHFTGNTSTFFHKQEVMPRFDVVKQDISGTPAITENIDKSRFIPSAFRQGEKLAYEERVAAPISGTFYNPLSNNFNPSIDQLRVANKQQISYEGRTKAGQMGSVRSVVAPVAKNRPETHYTLGPDRYFTSTGAIVKERNDYNYENFKPTSRQDQGIEYYGGKVAVESLASGVRLQGIDNTNELDFSSLFQEPKRVQLRSDTERNIGSYIPSSNDYGKSSYNLPELERDTTKQYNLLNVNKNTAGQRVALSDEARTTNKESLVNKRTDSGNIKGYIEKYANTGITNYDPKVTNKESLIYTNYVGNANKKDQVGYNIAKYRAKTTNKETTSDNAYTGNANKNDQNGYSIANVIAKTTNKETTSNNSYTGNANKNDQNGYSVANFRAKTTNKETTSDKSYIGPVKYHNQNIESRTKYNNAEISNTKETLVKGARPSGRKSTLGTISGGTGSIGDIKLTPNMLLKEKPKQRVENINIQQVTPSKEKIGTPTPVFNRHNEVENSRINSTLIKNQLSQNPFYNLN
jgi:hypothetical protein